MKRLSILFLAILVFALPVTAADYKYSSVTLTLGSAASPLTADTAFVLIDLSDTTNFAHSETNSIVIRQIIIDTYQSSHTALWQINVGTIVENDETNGTAHYFIGPLYGVLNGGVSITEQRVYDFPINQPGRKPGFDTKIDTDNDVMVHHKPNATSKLESTSWQNDTKIGSILGTGTNGSLVGEGDIVVYVDELAGSINFVGAITIIYYSE